MMELRETVNKYLALSGGYGKSVALSAFGLSREETERVFGQLDEDYHISRFFHFHTAAGAPGGAVASYFINGFPQTHVSIDAEVQEIL
ncbi:MAG: hypothetical protein WBS18_03105 [Candidatus Acidiferrales bacterium]